MIASTETSERDVKQTEASPQFTAAPPQLNPLAAGAPIEVTVNADGIRFEVIDDSRRGGFARESGTITDRVIARCERELQRRPQSARAYTNLGIALMNGGDANAAQEAFDKALTIDPKFYVASMNLARILAGQGRVEEAEHIYSSVAHSHEKDPAPVLGLAHVAIRRGQYDNAVEFLRKAMELGHKAITAKHLLGLLLLRLGKTRDAISILRAATHLQVREPALYEALGVAYSVSGDHRRAVLAFKSALSLTPWAKNSVLGLTQALLSLHRTDEAREVLVSYLEKNPQDDDAKRLLARAYAILRQYRFASAQLVQVWNHLEQSESEDLELKVELANNIGVNYFNNREIHLAEQWFLKAVAASPKGSALPYANLARVYLFQQLIPKAYDLLKHARALFGNHPDIISLMALCLFNVGSYKESVDLLKLVYEAGGATPWIYAQLSDSLAEGLGDMNSAFRIGKEAYQKFPNESVVVNNLAYLYLTLGDAQSARPILEKHGKANKEHDSLSELLLLATTGLLRIVEGDLVQGGRLYRKASRLAAQSGNERLRDAIMQKMYLELARAHLARQEHQSASENVQKGLTIDGGLLFKQQLQTLQGSLRSLPPGNPSR